MPVRSLSGPAHPLEGGGLIGAREACRAFATRITRRSLLNARAPGGLPSRSEFYETHPSAAMFAEPVRHHRSPTVAKRDGVQADDGVTTRGLVEDPAVPRTITNPTGDGLVDDLI